MSDIGALALYTQKQREFQVEGAALTRFTQDFMSAVNRSTRRISRDADLSTAIAAITNVDPSTMVGLDEAYEDVLSDLVSIEMVKMGQRPIRKEFELAMKRIMDDVGDRIDMIRTAELQADQDADTDEETSFIGMDRHS